MKILLIITVIWIGAVFASEEVPKCQSEIIRIQTGMKTAVGDDKFDYMNIHLNLMKLHKEELTLDDFYTFLEDFCPKVLIGIKYGFDQIPTIAAECADDEAIQKKTNMLKFFNVVFGKFCSDGGKGYKDMTKDKGTTCFFGNNDYKECFKSFSMPHFAEENFLNSNICKFIKVNLDCDHHLDKCDNHDVKTMQSEVNHSLKDKMKCTFEE